MNLIKIKRIYDPPEESDGYRVLVDRLWPRGISKEKAGIDEWAKTITPSTEIRKEFHHDPALMDEFKLKYILELDHNEFSDEFAERIRQKLDSANVTLLYAAKSQTINHATILKGWLEERIKQITIEKEEELMNTSNISFNIKGRWDGNRNGSGTLITNGVHIPISAPAGLDGPGIGSNPEELLLASAATCYFITLAAILSKREIGYSHLEISSEAIVQEEGNTLTYKEIIHRPVIILSNGDEEKKEMVEQLAQRAEKACFIGKTLKPGIAISVQPEVLFV